MITLPTAPWKEVAVDFAGPFPSRDYIVVVVDEFSRFPEVELLTSTSAKAVVPKLDAVFSRQGVPDILKSDNGPPLMGMSSKTLLTIYNLSTEKSHHSGQKKMVKPNMSFKLLRKTSGLPTYKARIGNYVIMTSASTEQLPIPQHMSRLVRL